jgi:heparosan-N-sulfate-glucuronate 5-epimerase
MNVIKNKYLFFIPRILKDIIHPTKWQITADLKSTQLQEYYFVFREEDMIYQKGGQKSIILDPDGIPLNPTYIDVKDKDYVYFPITIGQVGLAVFHSYLQSKKEEVRNRFMKYVDWFYHHADENPKLGTRWITHVALPQYRNPGPWQSAFAQSRGISLLLRGYQLTAEEKYKTMAEKALIPFTIPVAEGGVTSFTRYGPFYEEYTAQAPTLVLNGMIFSLFGVYDFLRVFPQNKMAKKIFIDGIQTLEKILPDFNLSYWSRYNLCRVEWYPRIDPATITYQHLHVIQMEVLYRLTGKEVFKKYSVLFKNQINIVNMIRMYLAKYKTLKQLKRL